MCKVEMFRWGIDPESYSLDRIKLSQVRMTYEQLQAAAHQGWKVIISGNILVELKISKNEFKKTTEAYTDNCRQHYFLTLMNCLLDTKYFTALVKFWMNKEVNIGGEELQYSTITTWYTWYNNCYLNTRRFIDQRTPRHIREHKL